MKVKICGLFRPVDIEYVNEALPDYIGFVFAKSRRQVTAEQAKEMKKILRPEIKTVGVFVDSPIEAVKYMLKDRVIDAVQLHGSESEDYIKRLKAEMGCEIVKAIRVVTEEDVIAAQESPADYILLDNGAGGTGEAFDWRMAEKCRKPFFLAGGINTGNLNEAIKLGNPFAIDLSSGVETDGVKDRNKILEIVRRVRNV